MPADHDYRHGGWREKYVIFKKCEECDGKGLIKGTKYLSEVKDYWLECVQCRGTGKIAPDHDAVYFVLRLDEDQHARTAALAYADSVQSENPEFARDIRAKVLQHTPVQGVPDAS